MYLLIEKNDLFPKVFCSSLFLFIKLHIVISMYSHQILYNAFGYCDQAILHLVSQHVVLAYVFCLDST